MGSPHFRVGMRLKFTYKNYRNEVTEREAFAKEIYFGTSPHHEGPQWFMIAFDYDKIDSRHFAMRDMTNVRDATNDKVVRSISR